MTDREIWKFAMSKKVNSNRVFGRHLVWIRKADFLKIKKFFKVEFNIFKPEESLRSQNLLLHVHAEKQGVHYMLHRDTGNVARFFPLGIIHLFVDVIPYIIIRLIKRKKMLDLVAMPKII